MSGKRPTASRDIMFDRAADSPAAWLFSASMLRNGASTVDWLDIRNVPSAYEVPNTYESDPRLTLLPWRHNPDLMWLFPVNRMLMGLSFENLLKGLLVAGGVPALKGGRLSKAFGEHDLDKLLARLDKPPLSFTPDERKLVSELSRFVVWQGRYPIPKSSHSYNVGAYMANDPGQHELEHDLWCRLRDRLVSIGWHKDVEGKRYKLKLVGGAVCIESESPG